MSDSTSHTAGGGTADLAGRQVSRIGFGAMQLDRLRDDRPAAIRLIRRAVELGVDHIDTAHFYGLGFMNDLIHEALRPEDAVTVVTKVGWEAVESGPVPLRLAQRPEQLRAGVEANLRSLGLDRLPVVNLRRADSGPALPVPPEQVVDLDDQLAELTALRDEGLVEAIGLSSTTIDVLRQALPAGIVCVSNAYSLVDRSDEDMLELCAGAGIAWVPYFPLGSAFPGFPKVADEPAVRAVAAQLAVTPAQVGLAWLLHHDAGILPIPGTATLAHLEANVAAGSLCLDDEMMDALDRIPTRVPDAPA